MKKDKTIYELELHECISISNNGRVRKVPGGWVYTEFEFDSDVISSVFVPWERGNINNG